MKNTPKNTWNTRGAVPANRSKEILPSSNYSSLNEEVNYREGAKRTSRSSEINRTNLITEAEPRLREDARKVKGTWRASRSRRKRDNR